MHFYCTHHFWDTISEVCTFFNPFWMRFWVTLSFSFVTLAVPAPTDLRFGLVGSDSMEVTWTSPRVPNRADINSFLIRYRNITPPWSPVIVISVSNSNKRWANVPSLCRYHPIDDEDDMTESSVTDSSNKVVLRSEFLKIQKCRKSHRQPPLH